MEIFFTILIMTVVVSLSGVASRISSFHIPLPLVQILAGAILAWPKFGLHVDFNPELFLVLFIPPLLFADGWKTSINEFMNNSREIVSLALVLVFITVIIVGYLIHWIVPGTELIAAFALAAVLSPTDAVALSSIIGEGRIPKKIMAILQGEALMNDASGLVSLKFAVSVSMGTMIFTVSTASVEFLKISIGGIFSGIMLCWLFGKSLRFFSKFTGDDPAIQTILLLLLPFSAYLLAEHFGLSGILATVSSGMSINRYGVMKNAPLAMRLRAHNVWQMLEFIFNGMVFLMLGLQLPDVIESSLFQAIKNPNIRLWLLFTDIFIIYVSLISLRFTWLYIVRKIGKKFLKLPMIFSNYSLREILITSFAGVRGSITLAGVLSIPLSLSDGKKFPARHELVFIATGVIIFSLLIGVILLPLLLRNFKKISITLSYNEMQFAKHSMAQAAINSLHKLEDRMIVNSQDSLKKELLKEISAKLIGDMRKRLDDKINSEQSIFIENLEKRLRLIALRAERIELYSLKAGKKISNETIKKLLHELDLMETLLSEI